MDAIQPHKRQMGRKGVIRERDRNLERAPELIPVPDPRNPEGIMEPLEYQIAELKAIQKDLKLKQPTNYSRMLNQELGRLKQSQSELYRYKTVLRRNGGIKFTCYVTKLFGREFLVENYSRMLEAREAVAYKILLFLKQQQIARGNDLPMPFDHDAQIAVQHVIADSMDYNVKDIVLIKVAPTPAVVHAPLCSWPPLGIKRTHQGDPLQLQPLNGNNPRVEAVSESMSTPRSTDPAVSGTSLSSEESTVSSAHSDVPPTGPAPASSLPEAVSSPRVSTIDTALFQLLVGAGIDPASVNVSSSGDILGVQISDVHIKSKEDIVALLVGKLMSNIHILGNKAIFMNTWASMMAFYSAFVSAQVDVHTGNPDLFAGIIEAELEGYSLGNPTKASECLNALRIMLERRGGVSFSLHSQSSSQSFSVAQSSSEVRMDDADANLHNANPPLGTPHSNQSVEMGSFPASHPTSTPNVTGDESDIDMEDGDSSPLFAPKAPETMSAPFTSSSKDASQASKDQQDNASIENHGTPGIVGKLTPKKAATNSSKDKATLQGSNNTSGSSDTSPAINDRSHVPAVASPAPTIKTSAFKQSSTPAFDKSLLSSVPPISTSSPSIPNHSMSTSSYVSHNSATSGSSSPLSSSEPVAQRSDSSISSTNSLNALMPENIQQMPLVKGSDATSSAPNQDVSLAGQIGRHTTLGLAYQPMMRAQGEDSTDERYGKSGEYKTLNNEELKGRKIKNLKPRSK